MAPILIYPQHRNFRKSPRLARSQEILENLARQAGIQPFPETRVSRVVKFLTHLLYWVGVLGLVMVVILLLLWLVLAVADQRIRLEPLMWALFGLGASIMLLVRFRHAMFHTDLWITYPPRLNALYQGFGARGVVYRGRIVSLTTTEKDRREIVYIYRLDASDKVFQGRYVTTSLAALAVDQELHVLVLPGERAQVVL